MRALMSDTTESKGSFFAQANQYVSDSFDELKKIHTPTKQETIQATVVTGIIVVFISCVVALMDMVFVWITQMVI